MLFLSLLKLNQLFIETTRYTNALLTGIDVVLETFFTFYKSFKDCNPDTFGA